MITDRRDFLKQAALILGVDYTRILFRHHSFIEEVDIEPSGFQFVVSLRSQMTYILPNDFSLPEEYKKIAEWIHNG